jgi:hypothetical protein
MENATMDMDTATVVGIRYDCHGQFDGTILTSNMVMIADVNTTLRELGESLKSNWEPDNCVYLIGFEETEDKDAPIYDDSVTLGSVIRPGLVLVYANIPLEDDVK